MQSHTSCMVCKLNFGTICSCLQVTKAFSHVCDDMFGRKYSIALRLVILCRGSAFFFHPLPRLRNVKRRSARPLSVRVDTLSSFAPGNTLLVAFGIWVCLVQRDLCARHGRRLKSRHETGRGPFPAAWRTVREGWQWPARDNWTSVTGQLEAMTPSLSDGVSVASCAPPFYAGRV